MTFDETLVSASSLANSIVLGSNNQLMSMLHGLDSTPIGRSIPACVERSQVDPLSVATYCDPLPVRSSL